MMNLKETGISIRVPAYMKEALTKDARDAGMSVGEYIRCVLFANRLMRYSNDGFEKVSRLKKAYESCEGMVPDKLVNSIFAQPLNSHDEEINNLIKRGIKGIEVVSKPTTNDEALLEMAQNIIKPKEVANSTDGNIITEEELAWAEQAIAEKDSVSEEVKEKAREEAERLNQEPPAIEQVKREPTTPKKPKRPKMGATNFMM